jgi:hypothetical protein
MLDEKPSELPLFPGVRTEATPLIDSGETAEGVQFESPAPVAAPAFNFEPGSVVSSARPASTTARPRARRKEGGALRMMVQTIGGGVLGLIIAQLILWWMPGKWANENRDPFGLAPKVAVYVPAIIPVSLRGATPTAQADRPGSDTSSSVTRPTTGDPNAGLETNIPDFSFEANQDSQKKSAPTGRDKQGKQKKRQAAAPEEEFPLLGSSETKGDESGAIATPDPVAPPPIKLELDAPVPTVEPKVQTPETKRRGETC